MTWIEEIIAYFGGVDRAAFSLLLLCAALLLFGFFTKMICLSIESIRSMIKFYRRRKLHRREVRRQLQYTLPERENDYLRSRLQTALTGREIAELTEEGVSVELRLEYAQKMLAEVRQRVLSPVERLEIEEIARLVALYQRQEKWSSSDVKAVNEVFAQLLKLSAKYEIAV